MPDSQQESQAQLGEASTELEKCDRATMQRKMIDDLYGAGPENRMKTLEDVSLSLLEPDKFQPVRELLKTTTKEVLQIALLGGLVDPCDVTVGRHGTITLTKDGLEKAEKFAESKDQPRPFLDGHIFPLPVDTSLVRKHLEQSGFFKRGHVSLDLLKMVLRTREHIPREMFQEYVDRISLEVDTPMLKLYEILHQIEQTPAGTVNFACVAKANAVLQELYARYEDRTLGEVFLLTVYLLTNSTPS
ncbi:hypothetical protein QQZ08_000181 [Neonectria magnoliae]|uniref:Uncharacterized protein n=1 Tax=Neonectria magnoliae TaxID=2732573 RepID=A0ABR1IHX1_9HYPO